MSCTFSPRQYQDIIDKLQDSITSLYREKNALQAKVDSLMLEFCPEEMTQEQIENLEQYQVESNYPKLIITTGDDVSDVVWTKEKLEEFQRVVDKIKQKEESTKQCCEDGQQWGRDWDCPKCTD